MKIVIESYKSEWQEQFEVEKNLLVNSIDEEVVIEHIGSTAVPGLGAKPVIDIMVGLDDFLTAEKHINSITELGYSYVSKYESEIPNRRFFQKELNKVRTHHIHMVGIDTPWWRRHIAFRDHLRKNVVDRDKYFALKMKLSEKDWNDRNDYAFAKTNFIKEIESRILV